MFGLILDLIGRDYYIAAKHWVIPQTGLLKAGG